MTICRVCQFNHVPAVTGGPCPRCSLTGTLAAAVAAGPADDYEFIAELGRGGMGVVTLVRQRSLDRLAALKVITAEAASGDGASRLLREARAAAAIVHSHVVAIHEMGQGATGAFIAMEYCEGGDLRARLRAGPLAPRAAAALGAKLAAAVAQAHAAGVLHRDLKPSNVLLTAAGEPKLADFGLSGSVAGQASEFTRTGVIAGSSAFVAPELLAGGVPSPAVDVYGLGAILYECLAGRAPFTGDSPAAVLAQVAASEPVPPRRLNPAVPPDLETIVLKCLEKSPAARYAGAAVLGADLESFLAGRPIAARPVSAAGRGWRWAKRNPALAAACAVIVLGTAAALGLLAERNARLRSALGAAETAGAQARAALRESLLAEARATRQGGREGQRRDALAAVHRAAAIRSGPDARAEAISALMLPEWTPHTELKAWSDPGWSTATPLPGFGAFIHESEAGGFSRRTFPRGDVAWTWSAAAPSAGQTVVSPDGRWCAVRLRNDEIHVLDAVTGQPVFSLPGRPYAFKDSRIWGYGADMAFSPDGTRFAATRAEGGVSVHAVPGGGQLAAWETPAQLICLAFSPDGRRLAAGGSRQAGANTVALLDAATGAVLAEDQPLTRVDFLAWSADDRWLAVGSRPVQVRAAADFSVRAVVPDRAALHGCFLPGADQLLLSEQIGQTRLWDIDSGRLLFAKQDGGRPGVWFDGTPVRQWRYYSDGRVDLQTLEPSPILTVHRASKTNYTVPSIADPLDFSPDGRWLLLGGWERPRLVDIATGAVHPLGEPGPANSNSVGRLEADGRTLWIGQSNGPLRRHELAFDPAGQPAVTTGEVVPGHDGFLPTALHRAAGLLALTSYQAGEVRLLDLRTRATKAVWALPRASHAAFSPDGRLVLTNAEPTATGRAEIRETATGRLVFAPGEQAGRTAAWSDDGRWVLAGIAGDKTGLWRAGTWQPGPALPANLQSSNLSGAFSPDGRQLVMRMEQELHLFGLEPLELLARIELPGSARYLCALRFTPDGRKLVAAYYDGRIEFWDLAALRTELAKLGLDWRD